MNPTNVGPRVRPMTLTPAQRARLYNPPRPPVCVCGHDHEAHVFEWVV